MMNAIEKIIADRLGKPVCLECGQPFTSSNVHTPEGWKETKLSQLCEDCFDTITAVPEDNEPNDDEPAL
jgi:hypothetical protein